MSHEQNWGCTMERVEDLSFCAKCGGLCCLRTPGKYNPEEFSSGGTMSKKLINDALDDGRASMSTTFVSFAKSQIAPLFFLAARGKDRPPLSLCHDAVRCSHLVGDRCKFSLEERPFECAMLVPSEDTSKCSLPNDLFMELLWIDHQDTLRDVIEGRTGHTWRDEMVEQLMSRKDVDDYSTGAYELVISMGLVEDAEEADETIADWHEGVKRMRAKKAQGQ